MYDHTTPGHPPGWLVYPDRVKAPVDPKKERECRTNNACTNPMCHAQTLLACSGLEHPPATNSPRTGDVQSPPSINAENDLCDDRHTYNFGRRTKVTPPFEGRLSPE